MSQMIGLDPLVTDRLLITTEMHACGSLMFLNEDYESDVWSLIFSKSVTQWDGRKKSMKKSPQDHRNWMSYPQNLHSLAAYQQKQTWTQINAVSQLSVQNHLEYYRCLKR